MDEIEIVPPRRPLAASIRVPGSKSITNRVLLLAAMATGRSTISGVGLNDDTRRMAAALGTLGFGLAVDETAARIVVDGRGGAVIVDSNGPGRRSEVSRRGYGITRHRRARHLDGRPGIAHVSLSQRAGAPGRL